MKQSKVSMKFQFTIMSASVIVSCTVFRRSKKLLERKPSRMKMPSFAAGHRYANTDGALIRELCGNASRREAPWSTPRCLAPPRLRTRRPLSTPCCLALLRHRILVIACCSDDRRSQKKWEQGRLDRRRQHGLFFSKPSGLSTVAASFAHNFAQ